MMPPTHSRRARISPGPPRRHFPRRGILCAALAPDVQDMLGSQSAVYFVVGGSEPDTAGQCHGYLDRRLGCYIYRTWHALHGGRPNLQRHHFFAKALRMLESEATRRSIPGLVATHRRLCDAAAALLESEVVSLRREDPASDGFPPPTGTARTWCEHGLSLGHMFRAVLLVADEHVFPMECPVRPVEEFPGHDPAWKVAAGLEQLTPECGVLMKISEESKLAEEFYVVRVKIGVAMRFMFDLQAEEEAAIPSLRQVSAMLTWEREGGCHAWVESVLRHASLKEVGVDGNRFTWEAVRRINAEVVV
ncbi:hypothetical protein F5Y05DRAFT_413644 [Hypoxylon sp. FL0543]|nr:hypothetical protein F5Y05DRAFT_413644 [Hypoxylon sp. FL0543]